MINIKLSYAQLREILAIVVSNKDIKLKIEDLLSGNIPEVTEMDILELIASSGAEKEVIHILSGKDPGEIDAMDGLEYLAAFFAYMRVNSKRLAGWLESIGLKTQGSKKTTLS